MRRLVLILSLCLLASIASAQPRAIGVRGGWAGRWTAELDYQHTIVNDHFIEMDLGLFGNGFRSSTFFNFMLAQPYWSARGQWSVYAGPGISLGFTGNIYAAVAAQVGLEYRFSFPMFVAIDIRPSFPYVSHKGIYTEGIFGAALSLGIAF